MRDAKIKFYENKFRSVSFNSKLTQRLINEVIGIKSLNKDKIDSVQVDDNIINTEYDILGASIIGSNVGKNLGEKFKDNACTPINMSNNMNNEYRIF